MSRLILTILLHCVLPSCSVRFNSKFYQSYGVLLEPIQTVLSYDDISQITLVYKFVPSTPAYSLVCNQKIKHMEHFVNNTLKSRLNFLYSMIPHSVGSYYTDYCKYLHGLCNSEGSPGINFNSSLKTESKRSKRGLPLLLAAGVGAMATGYNTYKSVTNSQKLEKLEEIINRLSAYSQNSNQNFHEFEQHSNSLFSKISKSFQIFHDTLVAKSCSQNLGGDFSGYMSIGSWLDIEVNSLVDMLSGKVNPHIITTDLLQEILTSNNELVSTIYNSDPGVFYQASKSYLIQHNLSLGIMVFNIEIPIISKFMISPLFSVLNGGWMDKGILHKMVLPDKFYLFPGDKDNNFHAVSAQDLNCRENYGIFICDNSRHYFNYEMVCLNALLKEENNDLCDAHISHPPIKGEVYKTSSGLLISGYKDLQFLDSVGKFYHSMKPKSLSESYTNFISYNSFQSVRIDDLIIVSPGHKLNTVIIKNSSVIFPPISKEDMNFLLNFHTNLKLSESKKILETDFRSSPFYHYETTNSGLYIDIVVVIIIMVLVAVVIYLIKRQKETKLRILRVASRRVRLSEDS
ncbi:MAG: hypothetical protein FCPL1_gp3 [Hangzhou cletus punctiger lispivirus 1]|uniref:Glycoprotein n=1 Tax=Hangzhou cletus punctiger lispivirus 1 TaxID=2905566 RepID=A0A8K1XVX8_9MONO|nr:MAG: hypothetical protein QKV05_gp3 [Hangzhou cletus punctiger lispivirus 1]UHK03161.1 MAG: hypothetical protein FCPL1_gp3 [Hangzhou cletus punctiger lispivirus 1]